MDGRSSRSRSNSTLTAAEPLHPAAFALQALGHQRVAALAALLVGAGDVEVVLLRERPGLGSVPRPPAAAAGAPTRSPRRRPGGAKSRCSRTPCRPRPGSPRDGPSARMSAAGSQAIAGVAAVLLGQEVHGEVDPGQLPARRRQVARLPRSPGRAAPRRSSGAAPPPTGRRPRSRRSGRRHPLFAHLLQPPVDEDCFSSLKSGNPVAQQPADAVALLEDGHRVAGAGELLGGRQAGRPRAHHGHGAAAAPLGPDRA